jgi:hypothetical protein
MITMLLAACAARPTLEPRPGGNPGQIDLSGRWVLRAGGELPVNNEQTIRLPRPSQDGNSEMRRPAWSKRDRESSVHLFLESGKALKVSQTDYGLFISFDRAVVEEYTFGEFRAVSVGPIQAQRVSGWDGDRFTVETMDEEGNLLTERWYLDGELLVRDIMISAGGESRFSKRQEFEAR